MKASSSDSTPGLRERQKAARYERILASARSLFNRLDFDDTTMAAIAAHAEVSTPTVFNYFKTKDQLLLALVLQVHHETRHRIHSFDTAASANLADAISEFLGTYTKTSLKSINRKTWRHVESTRIRLPGSDFVKKYDALTIEMFEDFYRFLEEVTRGTKLFAGSQAKSVAEMMFNQWSALFIELIRDEGATIENHVDRLHGDIKNLLDVMARPV
ncbi:MAG: TetR/AcrR family transcriptional regulator [Gammaproteobacteria bacterium]|nr:TetR/AcrR family transcriptional regulator [Gammaproteobacteria bacterium]